jgi:PAS domain S-box-containing protein
MPNRTITLDERQAVIINWLAGILAIAVLILAPINLSDLNLGLWLMIVSLTAIVINIGLTFSEGEINAAHTVGIMAYLILATPDGSGDPLWAISIGTLIGVFIREARHYNWTHWDELSRTIWEPAIRSIGQIVLSLATAGWIYRQLDGQIPLRRLETSDLLPLLGFVAVNLAVYLALTLVYMRSRKGQQFNALLLNWQSLVGILLIPIPMAILGASAYHSISTLAFEMLAFGFVVMLIGVYGLSHTQHRYEQRVQDLSTLTSISNAMRTSLDLSGLVQTLYLRIASLLNIKNFAVALYEPTTKQIRFPICVRDGIPISLPPYEIEETERGERAATLIPEYIINHAHEIGLLPPNLSSRSWLGVPIDASDQTLGALIIAAENNERQFTAQEKHLLATIAAQSGVAFDNAQLYEQAHNRVQQLRTLTQVSATLSSTLDAQQVLEDIVTFARDVVGADAAAIYMWWDEAKQTIVLVRHSGLSEDFINQSPIPFILEEPNFENRRQPFIITDSHQNSQAAQLRPIFDAEGKRAWAEVLLRNAQDILGVLVVYYNTPHSQTDEDIEVFRTYANQAALAISNAQLYTSKDAALNRRVEQLTLLEALGYDLFSSRVELGRSYEQALKRAIEGTGAHAGLITLRDIDTRIPQIVAELGCPPDTDLAAELTTGITAHVLKTADATLVDDLNGKGRFIPIRHESQSQLCVPILHDINVIGTITLESNTPDSFGHEDMIFIMQIGAQIRIALDNTRLIESIEATRDRLQIILDSMVEAVLLLDLNGAIRLANPQVKNMLGLPVEEITNRTLSDIQATSDINIAQALGVSPDEFQDLTTKRHNPARLSEPAKTSFSLTIDNQQLVIDRTDVPVRDQQGDLIGWLMVFVDVTEEHELAQSRADLSSMIVHDLRSPLTAINASFTLINALADEENNALHKTMRQTTDTAARAVRKLLNLVNSLLDISKLEHGMMTLEREAADARHLALAVIKELEPIAQEMEIHLTSTINTDIPPLDIDAEKIERVLLNLVDNAIKFTPADGKVIIRATPEPDNLTSDIQLIRLQVIDTGAGIPDEYKTVLFDRYQQISGRKGRRRGTGLGLAFCRLAVEAHGGRIWIEDNPDGGSIFNFTLPALTADL